MISPDLSQWMLHDVGALVYYVSVTLVVASVFACCVSITIRTACIAQVLSLVVWRLERKQLHASGRSATVSRTADGTSLWSAFLLAKDAPTYHTR
jgi:hypothetical protein